MKRHCLLAWVLLLAVPAAGLAQTIKTPPAAEVTAMDADFSGSDAAARAAAVEKLKGWVKGGYVSDHLWRNWIPALQKDGKNQDAADLSLAGILHRPDPAAAYTMMTFRYQALTALGKNEEALAAAKSYFNVVQMTQTTRALDAIAGLLAKVHPEDPEIVRKFRAEQTDAAAGKPAPGNPIMKSIKFDASIYEETLKAYKDKTDKDAGDVKSRIGYGDLLLLADKGEDAEKIFREAYVIASDADLPAVTEGIAKAIRAQDGNPVRANAWYKEIQATQATRPASQPATRGTTGGATTGTGGGATGAATVVSPPKVDMNLP